jgi:hypothetical protein
LARADFSTRKIGGQMVNGHIFLIKRLNSNKNLIQFNRKIYRIPIGRQKTNDYQNYNNRRAYHYARKTILCLAMGRFSTITFARADGQRPMRI